MAQTTYSKDFFSLHLKQSVSSAEQTIPIVLDYVQPHSIVDVGCGIGTWLSEWKKKGVTNVLGIDGEYVNLEQLMISRDEFSSHDLSVPFSTEKKFDLVSSLEVGEHIDAKHAEVFVKTLCSLGDIVLFSAAIPGQEGTYHINEQYPAYWAEIFSRNGFIPVDCLRARIWDNNNISWWYRQNILFFIKKNNLSAYPKLEEVYNVENGKVMSLVHPELLKFKDSRLSYLTRSLSNPFRTALYYAKKIIGRN